MMVLQTLLVLTASLLVCSGESLTRDKLLRMPGLDMCGILVFDEPPKVPSGTKLGESSWIAALGYTSNGSRAISWSCVGSLITDQHLLTAAQCVHPDTIPSGHAVTTVRLGELDLNEAVMDGAQPLDIPVDRVIIHKEYNKVQKTNDIAIIKLKSKVTFTKFINPICLPPPEFEDRDFVGYFPSVAGWDRSEENRPRNDTRLKKDEVKIENLEDCRRNVTSEPNLSTAIIDNRVICASSPDTDTCKRDLGHPMMLQRKHNQPLRWNYFLMGIYSYGHSCAKKGYTGFYTRVSKHMLWIFENLDI